ncbi:MAG: hypothetical protein IKQ61_02985 [Spirochaetales bacterium]|nr:hypothetical protein [Spirochaetales bacterium]
MVEYLCCINWDMWSAIGTCGAVIAAVIIANKQNNLSEKIADKQAGQEDLQIRISLFDKRYEIYQCFMKYWNIANKYFATEWNDQMNDSLIKLYNELFDNNSSDVRAEMKSEYIDLKEKNAIKPSTQELAYIQQQIYKEDNIVANKDSDTVSRIAFCFDNIPCTDDIKDLLSKITRIIIDVDKNGTTQKEIYKDIQSTIQIIQNNKVQEKLEEQLQISYDDLRKSKKKNKIV